MIKELEVGVMNFEDGGRVHESKNTGSLASGKGKAQGSPLEFNKGMQLS